jgi:ATP-binding cassette subfamily F protein 3
MRHALTVALQGFEGALVVVSHDRHLLSNTVDEFYSIHNGRCQEFEGDLHDYERWMQEHSKSSTGTAASSTDEKKGDRKEQRQQAAAQRQQLAPLRNEIKKLEQQMEKAHKQLAEVEGLLADATLYEEERKSQLAELLLKQSRFKADSESMEEQWLEKSEAFEVLSQ